MQPGGRAHRGDRHDVEGGHAKGAGDLLDGLQRQVLPAGLHRRLGIALRNYQRANTATGVDLLVDDPSPIWPKPL